MLLLASLLTHQQDKSVFLLTILKLLISGKMHATLFSWRL